MESILPGARGEKFKTDDAYLWVKYFINAEDTEDRKIAWHLAYWFRGEVLYGQMILRSAPASFRFPFSCLGWSKTQGMSSRAGLWKKTKQHDWLEAICLGCCWKPRRIFQRRGVIVIKRWWCPRVCGEAVKTDLKHYGASSGRPLPMSCTLTDCTYLWAKIWAQPSCGQWKLTFPYPKVSLTVIKASHYTQFSSL